MITLDTETCGLVGPMLTAQWSEDDGPISIHEVWETPVRKTLQIIERFADSDICGWNLAFDWFHIPRAYTVLRLLPPARPPTIAGWCAVEREATRGPCVKPRSAMDVWLHSRQGPCQALMNRKDIRIRRVPKALAETLAAHLTATTTLDPIYFARRAQGMLWECESDPDVIDGEDFPDVVLHFGSRGGLKPLARHLLGEDCQDYPVEKSRFPKERLWDPVGSRDWQRVIDYHIGFWHETELARQYAKDDVRLTRALWKHFGSPPPGDDNSTLACQVGAARWRGWSIDRETMEQMRAMAEVRKDLAPRAPKEVLYELKQRLSPAEAAVLRDTRTEPTLTAIADEHPDDDAGNFARMVIAARSSEKEIDLCNKVLEAERAHFSFNVLATLSNRMGGTDDMNGQAIPNKRKGSRIREGFTLADGGMQLWGGDFKSFEVSIAAAVYNDPQLNADLATGLKMHALWGGDVYGLGYEAVKDDPGLYDRSKKSFFAKLYGAEADKLGTVLNLPEDKVLAGIARFETRYPKVAEARKRIADGFCSMKQTRNRGPIEWHEPREFVDSLFGARRWFTLENNLARYLFEMAQNPPKELRMTEGTVHRRANRSQTPGGALQTAIFACAFSIQAAAMRQAANHEIQASGATITKRLQCNIWKLQPHGVHPWVVQPLNEHDSIMLPTQPESSMAAADVVSETLHFYRPSVPMIDMDWFPFTNWGDK